MATDDFDWRQIITIEPGKRSGKPCIRGLRITVYDVLGYLAGGMTFDEIFADFPDLTHDDIRAACAYAVARDQMTVSSRAFDANLHRQQPVSPSATTAAVPAR